MCLIFEYFKVPFQNFSILPSFFVVLGLLYRNACLKFLTFNSAFQSQQMPFEMFYFKQILLARTRLRVFWNLMPDLRSNSSEFPAALSTQSHVPSLGGLLQYTTQQELQVSLKPRGGWRVSCGCPPFFVLLVKATFHRMRMPSLFKHFTQIIPHGHHLLTVSRFVTLPSPELLLQDG